MKKHKITMLIAVILILIPTICFGAIDIFDTPDNISVNDYSMVISEETKSYIRSCNDSVMELADSKIIIVTVPTTGQEQIDVYASRLYDSWNVKSIGNNTSTFILVATDDMEYWIIVGENLKNALTPDIVNTILLENMEPDFAVRNFDAAIRKTYNGFNMWYSSTFRFTPKQQEEQKKPAKNSVDIGAVLIVLLKVILYAIAAIVAIIIIYAYIKREIRLRQLARMRRQRKRQYANHIKEKTQQ